MNNEKRFVLFIILMFFWMMGFPYVMRLLGLNPPPKKPPGRRGRGGRGREEGRAGRRGEGAGQGRGGEGGRGTGQEAGGSGPRPSPTRRSPKSPWSTRAELVLGSETDSSPGGYRLEAQLTQKGAGIESLSSSRFDAEYEDGRAVKRPLQLIETGFRPGRPR